MMEQTIKKHWLIGLILYCITSYAYQIFFTNLAIEQTYAYSPLMQQLVLYLLPLVFTALFAAISYYNAYLKRGTKWLAFLLVMIGLNVFSTLFLLAKQLISDVQSGSFHTFDIAVLTVLAVTSAYFAVYCSKLYVLNNRNHPESQ